MNTITIAHQTEHWRVINTNGLVEIKPTQAALSKYLRGILTDVYRVSGYRIIASPGTKAEWQIFRDCSNKGSVLRHLRVDRVAAHINFLVVEIHIDGQSSDTGVLLFSSESEAINVINLLERSNP